MSKNVMDEHVNVVIMLFARCSCEQVSSQLCRQVVLMFERFGLFNEKIMISIEWNLCCTLFH